MKSPVPPPGAKKGDDFTLLLAGLALGCLLAFAGSFVPGAKQGTLFNALSHHRHHSAVHNHHHRHRRRSALPSTAQARPGAQRCMGW